MMQGFTLEKEKSEVDRMVVRQAAEVEMRQASALRNFIREDRAPPPSQLGRHMEDSQVGGEDEEPKMVESHINLNRTMELLVGRLKEGCSYTLSPTPPSIYLGDLY
jgi:hypothetical protein